MRFLRYFLKEVAKLPLKKETEKQNSFSCVLNGIIILILRLDNRKNIYLLKTICCYLMAASFLVCCGQAPAVKPAVKTPGLHPAGRGKYPPKNPASGGIQIIQQCLAAIFLIPFFHMDLMAAWWSHITV